MTPELIGIVTVGVALAGLALVSIRENARVLRTEITAVRGEIKDMRGEMREDMDKRFEAVHAEMRDMRAEMKAEIKELREDTSQQFEAVHTEMKAVRGEMARLRERMARIEGMFDGFLRRDSRQARESRRESETAAA